MEPTNQYVVIDGFKDFLSQLYHFLLKKKIWIGIFCTFCALCGLTLSLLIKPRYIGKLTFAMQNAEEGGGGLSGLAGQFGLSLGSSSGTFSGDNIYELLTSRTFVEKALLAPIQTPEGERSTLLNEYIKTYKMAQKWEKSEFEEVRNLQFPPEQRREDFSRVQDSIIGNIYETFIKKSLIVYKVDKQLSIGGIEISSKSEFFSKEFVEKLIEETGKYYIETKTKLSRKNYQAIKLQVDSVKALYDQVALEYALLADRNVASIRQSAQVEMMQKQTEMHMLSSSYIEMVKNLELIKMTISKQTPLIEVIDPPIMPLEIKQLGSIVGIIGGGLIGGFCSIGFFTALFIWIRRKELL